MDVIKVFDACIKDLEKEIEGIENGDFDSNILAISSYAIKPQFESIIGKYCSFPPAPSLNEIDDTIDVESVDVPTPTSHSQKLSVDDDDINEQQLGNDTVEGRRSSGRSARKRKANAIESSEETSIDTGDISMVDPSPGKPPLSASKTASRRSSRSRGQ